MNQIDDIRVIVENGEAHYMILDSNGNSIHCDMNELQETIVEILQ